MKDWENEKVYYTDILPYPRETSLSLQQNQGRQQKILSGPTTGGLMIFMGGTEENNSKESKSKNFDC